MRAERDVLAGPGQLSMAWDDEPPAFLEGWKAIADRLQRSVSWCHEQDLPVYTLGDGSNARVRIDLVDLLAWLERRKKETTR